MSVGLEVCVGPRCPPTRLRPIAGYSAGVSILSLLLEGIGLPALRHLNSSFGWPSAGGLLHLEGPTEVKQNQLPPHEKTTEVL